MIQCLSVSHKIASLPMLETLKIADSAKFSNQLLSNDLFQECVVLQTCHRVEIFLVTSDINSDLPTKQALKLWSVITGVSLDIIEQTTQVLQGKEALQHLFYLASGLESVILGEDQVLGQVRSAWLQSKTDGTTGFFLDSAFTKAINIGRKVRNETKINEGSTSISSAAIDLAKQELGDLVSRKALIIGAGEAGALAAEALRSEAISRLIIANRTYEKSIQLADKISGKAIPFDDIMTAIPEMDIVVTAVSVTQPLLEESQFASIAKNFVPTKRLLLIDISQPRAIEERIGLLNGVSLKTIDDLKQLVGSNLKNRSLEAEKAKVIVENELLNYEMQQAKLAAQPIITKIYRQFEEIRQKEFSRAVRKMKENDQKKILILDRFSRELTERIAQIPIEQLRTAALANDGRLLSVAQRLFQTEETER